MTVFETLYTPAWVLVTTPILLFLILHLYLIFAAFGHRRSRAVKILYILHFLLSFSVMNMFFYLDSGWITHRDWGWSFTGLYKLFTRVTVWMVIIYYVVSSFIIAAALWDTIHYRRTHLTSDSIKETMDLLPVGIAFARSDGTAVFSNMTTNSISRELTGKDLINTSDFQKATASPLGESPFVVLSEAKDLSDDNRTVHSSSGVWQIDSSTITAEGEDYIQLTATDVSKQVVYTRELEEKNKKLREIRMRLDIYNKQADRMIISQELLTARMAVHNELGNVLLESRHYLNDPKSFDEEVLLEALKNTNTYLLREYEEDDTARDPLADAMEMADTIGVDVQITGVIPPADPARSILAAAVIECATNTVKHANGDEVYVNICPHGAYHIILRNNGIQPEGKIRESGGLLSLRTLVENEGGSMEISTEPAFNICVILPTENKK